MWMKGPETNVVHSIIGIIFGNKRKMHWKYLESELKHGTLNKEFIWKEFSELLKDQWGSAFEPIIVLVHEEA